MGTAPSATPFPSRATLADPAEELRRARRWLTVAGVLSLLGGIIAIALPNIASVATAIFVGWLLVFVSALSVVDAFSTRDGRRIALRLLIAALSLVAGLYLLVAPLDGTFTLTVVLLIALELPESATWAIGLVVGVDLLFSGILLLSLARSLRPA